MRPRMFVGGQSLPGPASSKSGHVRYAPKADGLADRDRSLPTCRTGSEVLAAAPTES
jgi:hypothetical protein